MEEEEVPEAGTKRPRARDDIVGDDAAPSPIKDGQQWDHVKSSGMERGPGQGQELGSKSGEGEGPAKKKKRKKNNRPLERSVGTGW